MVLQGCRELLFDHDIPNNADMRLALLGQLQTYEAPRQDLMRRELQASV